MKTGYKVGDAMTQNPIKIKSDASLKKCADLMAKKHIGSVLVESKGKIVGVLSEQDIVRKAVAKGTAGKKKVRDVMETDLITITPDKDIFEAIRVMRNYNIRHLPVMNQDEFLGLITMKDILKIEPDLFDLLIEKFEIREAKKKPAFNLPDKEGACEICGEYAEELSPVDGVQVCADCEAEL
ncbi:CBS domain-containing protein [Candidatus Woesearchaeota archaeon]|nr:CBS domain-containing protein [Candidatus Woesearchaeota archaeon]MBW2994124.1 CBS domain-containing protein [Candidatus Woesearchaeota archaeon]